MGSLTLAGWGSIRDVPGVLAGHAQRTGDGWLTGVTVVIPPPGTIGSVDVRGGGPGTHETDALDPVTLVPTVDAVVLTGGSAFGLASAGGVQRWCREQERGFAAGPPEDPRSILVPIVPAAAIFDLARGGSVSATPDAEMGYSAAVSAASGTDPLAGRAGAGTGARMAARTLPGGTGSASRPFVSTMPGTAPVEGVVVGALAVVNALGSPITPAGAFYAASFLPSDLELPPVSPVPAGLRPHGTSAEPASANTTLVVIATNARLDPGQCQRTAVCGHDGIARALVPAHTMLDGDTVFALSTGEVPVTGLAVVELQALAAQVAMLAIADAARRALPPPS